MPLEICLSNNFKKDIFIERISNMGILFNEKAQSVSIKFHKNIFFITHSVTIEFFNEKLSIAIDYRPLINSTIILLLFIAFFSKISVGLFIALEIIIPIIFIAINLALIINMCKNAIRFASKEVDNKIISDEQNKWILDPLRCSGCGESISRYDYKCSECGLYCKPKADHSRFSSTNSKYFFNYTIK